MLSDEEYSKKVNALGILCIVGAILGVLGILLVDTSELAGTGIENLKTIMAVIDGIIFVILLVLTYLLSKKKNMAGPILGIVLGALDILHLSVWGILVGIYIIMDCAKLRKIISAYKKENKPQEENV